MYAQLVWRGGRGRGALEGGGAGAPSGPEFEYFFLWQWSPPPPRPPDQRDRRGEKRNHPQREVVRSSAGAGVVSPPPLLGGRSRTIPQSMEKGARTAPQAWAPCEALGSSVERPYRRVLHLLLPLPTALPWQGVWAATTTFGEEAGVEASVVVCVPLRPPRPCHPEKNLKNAAEGC